MRTAKPPRQPAEVIHHQLVTTPLVEEELERKAWRSALGALVRLWRARFNLSQQEACEQLGVSQATLSRIEEGASQHVDLLILSHAMGHTPASLTGLVERTLRRARALARKAVEYHPLPFSWSLVHSVMLPEARSGLVLAAAGAALAESMEATRK